jgi:hypothetical protein
MRSQSLSLAQLRSQQIGEGWKRLHIYRVDRGLPTNGRERYGYLAHRTTHIRNDGALPLNLELDGVVDDPEQVAWVDPSHEGS